MASSKNRVLWDFFANTKQLEKGLRDANAGFKTTESATDKLKGALKGLAVAFGAREVAQWASDAVQLAVAAAEVDSRFREVFGTATNLKTALREWGDMAGVTETKAEDLASSIGNLAQTQGFSADESEDFALKLAILAGDIASFQDLDPEEVLIALNKGLLTTEREGLKAFGLAITAAEVDTVALQIAVDAGRDSITKQDKAMAAYEIAVDQAGKAIGDLEKTQDSVANQQRQTTATFEEFQEAIGEELLPVYQDFLVLLSDSLPALKLVVKGVKETIGPLKMLGDIVSDLTDPFGALTRSTENSMEKIVGWSDTIMLVVNPAAWALNKAQEALGLGFEDMVQPTKDAAEAQWELSQGAHAAREALRDEIEIGEPYKEFAKGMALWADSAQASTDKIGDVLTEFDRKLALFSGDLFKHAREVREAGEQYAEALKLFAGGGGSGQTDDPVADAHSVKSITDLDQFAP